MGKCRYQVSISGQVSTLSSLSEDGGVWHHSEASPRILFGQTAKTWLLPSQNVSKNKSCERMVPFRVSAVDLPIFSFLRFCFFPWSNQWCHCRFPDASLASREVVSSLRQSFARRHVCLLVSKLLACDSIFNFWTFMFWKNINSRKKHTHSVCLHIHGYKYIPVLTHKSGFKHPNFIH